jgi:predicted nucleic acid-binding protein
VSYARRRRRSDEPASLVELRRVLVYPKLAEVIAGASELVDLLEASSVVVMPKQALAVVSDESDSRILEAAVEGGVDY